MKATGKAMCGVGYETQWESELGYNYSGSGDFAFSTVENIKAEEWPVITLHIPFQTGQENAATEFFIKLEQFMKDNFPEPKTIIGLPRES